MELRHLRYFVAVADRSSVRKAAEALHISQPPLSMQLKDLERELGAELFVREKRSMRLTEAGKSFLVSARKILEDAQKAKLNAKLAAEGKIGKIAIRFISSAAAGVLQTTVSGFKKNHPLIEFDLQQSYAEKIVKDVADGHIDIGFIRVPFNLPDNILSKLILRESFFVALPKTHHLTKKKEISPIDLKNEKLILDARNTANSFHNIISIFTAQGITPKIIQGAIEDLTIAGLVATGTGYSIVPECMTKIRVPGVSHAPLKGGKNKTSIIIITQKTCTPIAKAFIEESSQL